jgi:hypothetical protein
VVLSHQMDDVKSIDSPNDDLLPGFSKGRRRLTPSILPNDKIPK